MSNPRTSSALNLVSKKIEAYKLSLERPELTRQELADELGKSKPNSHKWLAIVYPQLSPLHNPPARSYNTHRAISSITTFDTIEDDLAYSMRLDTRVIMLNPCSYGIVCTGNSTIQHRLSAAQGIITSCRYFGIVENREWGWVDLHQTARTVCSDI